MNGWLILIPLLAAGIGYSIVRIAIHLLFNSKKSLPERHPQLAQQLGKLVSQEFLSFDELEQKINSPENIHKIMPEVEKHVDVFLREKLKVAFPIIGSFIGDRTINELKILFMNELEQIFPVVMKEYMKNLQKDLDLEQMVTNKLASFSGEKLKSVLYNSLSKELRTMTIIGTSLGFIAGIIQLLIVIAVTN